MEPVQERTVRPVGATRETGRHALDVIMARVHLDQMVDPGFFDRAHPVAGTFLASGQGGWQVGFFRD